MITFETGMIGLILLLTAIALLIKQMIRTYHHWQDQPRSQTLLLAYTASFLACTLANLFDVTLFDLRVNVLTWSVMAVISSQGEVPKIPGIKGD
jgi:O-antigen ligase